MKLGFIGTGNMASAIMGGILAKGLLHPEEICGADPSEAGRKRVREAYGIRTTADNGEAAAWADILFLSVKPQFYQEVIQEIRERITPEKLVITLAPGKTLSWLEKIFDSPVRLVRTMPNTPALVGEGMTGACANEVVGLKEREQVEALLSAFGRVEWIPERLMDAVVSVSGSSPAYVFMLIEAMADGAVAQGMPRGQAYAFAAQAVYGSAKMVLETGRHPGELKDMVCSPGGTTIEAVRVLEEKGFRSAVLEAMEACAEKSKNL